MSTVLRAYIRNLEYEMTLIKAELEACVEKNWEKKGQIEHIIKTLNTPNTGDEYVIQEIIKVLDLEMTQFNGWAKRAILKSQQLRTDE